MKIIFRIIAVLAMIVATLFFLLYVASIAGLWTLNTPTTSMLTGALTVSDELLLETEQVMETTDNVLVEVLQLGQEVGAAIDSVQKEQAADAQSLQPVQGATDRFNESITQLEGNLNEWRGKAQAMEQSVALLIPRVPVYIDLMWIGITLVLLWLALAQVALFYLALVYLRTGGLGWTKQVQNPDIQAIPLTAGL